MTVVAIDGPAGAGKSTIAKALAARLGVVHVDTGAYYRAAALATLRAGADPADPAAVTAALSRSTISRASGRTVLNGRDVEADIRGAAVTAIVSAVSAHPQVRRTLITLQRQEIAAGGAVVEGRDAGTAVVPDADLKVWLTAPVGVRAARRAAQLGAAGAEAIDAHVRDIARRDDSDAAQMQRADGVVEVDTGMRTVAEVVDEIVALVSNATIAAAERT